MKYGFLIDITKCRGCEECVAACIRRNNKDPLLAEADRVASRDGLTANRLSTVQRIEDGRFAKKSCMHCLEPSCVSACLVGGITKRPDGPVVYDPDKCIGCRYCMLACPFHIPRYEWRKTTPYMVKCDMCADRIDEGKIPACVEACPYDAIVFGPRRQLLQRANTRIRENPEIYRNHIWGESEFGGTSVLYISDVDLAALGWPDAVREAIPNLTEPLIHKTPFMGMSVAIGLVALNWIVKRRNKLAAERAAEMDPTTASKSEEHDS
jgi:formate dehydrogenase iron-sulfur subunit